MSSVQKNARRSFRFIWMTGLVIVLSYCVPGRAGGAGSANRPSTNSDPSIALKLFVDVAQTRAISRTPDPTAIRTRYVAVQMESLPKVGADDPETIPFNLFPDADFTGVVTHLETRSTTRFTVSGILEDVEHGQFILVRQDNVIVADIHAHDLGNFEVRVREDGVHLIREVNESALAGCGFGPGQMPARNTTLRAVERSVEGDGPAMDVMVIYTAEARQSGGGAPAMNGLAQLFVDATNDIYQNSQIDARLRLVYAGEVNYVESGSATTDLNRLTSPTDGYLDQVHSLRVQYGADLVALLVNDFDYCGIAWMMNGPTRAFSVSDFGCGSATFAHELGHNMGCAHDRQNAHAQGRYSYSYGHRWYGQSGTLFRTTMSYAPGTRIPNFSNPNILYDGVPTGVPEGSPNSADNARTINNTAPTIAGYRPAADMTDCNGNFVPDDVDISGGTSADCNDNNVPDECDVASGSSDDANGNDVPDECECDPSACDDRIACTLDSCDPTSGACVHQTGAIPYGDLNYDGGVDLDDVSCVVSGYANALHCPRGDISPCGGDGLIELDDLTAIVDAYGGIYRCPSPCP